jgi:hypothetical protein
MASRSMSPEYLPVPYQSLEAGRAELVLHLRGYLLMNSITWPGPLQLGRGESRRRLENLTWLGAAQRSPASAA